MGRLLAALIADSETALAANPANPANFSRDRDTGFADSQDSQAFRVEADREPVARFADSQDSQQRDHLGAIAARVLATRVRLLSLADVEGVDAAHVHTLTVPDVDACAGQTEYFVRAYLRALRDSAMREQGKRPDDETASILCVRCGIVFAAPEVAAVLPVIGGLPTAAGCAWCGNRKRALPIPRPPVTCGTCEHFEPDRVNPPAGLGRCGVGLDKGPLPYPFAQRTCASWRPSMQKEVRA
jgi:hypothetical protein